MTEATGDLLFWNGSIWSNIATSSLGISSSLWNQSGSDINYTDGNVGIGTSTPSQRLHITNSLADTSALFSSEVDNSGSFDTGIISPGTSATDTSVGTEAWVNTDNIFVEDDTSASIAGGRLTGTSHYLTATNFGFSIPSGTTIVGVKVEIRKRDADAFATVEDNSVKLIKGGSIVGADKADAGAWPESFAYTTYGGSADLWSETLSSSDVNASNFGVGLSAVGSNDGQPLVDHIRITVYYTTSGTLLRNFALGIDNSDSGMFKFSGSSSLGTSDYLTITNSGNFGIGTSTPGSKLSISGGASIGASYSTTAAPSNGLIVEGNVGIGTTTPTSTLTVVGSGSLDTFTVASSTGSSMLTVAADGSATFVGSGGTCTINGSGACSSDERLKTAFNALDNRSALGDLMTLRTGTYLWADSNWNQERNMGVLAQDLLNTFPELVGQAPATFMGETDTYYTVNYAGLTVPIIAAVKELNLKLEDLATTTTFTELESDSFTKRFFEKLIAWFSDTANGIGTMVASVFNATEMICVDGECLNAADIRELKDSIGSETAGLADGEDEAFIPDEAEEGDANVGDVSAGDVAVVVTVVGDTELTLEVGDTYEELGATATDADGEDITESVVIGGDTVATSTAGTYIVTYTATDANEVTGSSTRTVTVIEAQPDDASADGEAEADVPGCTDPEALNYNEDATEDDDSCEYEDDEEPTSDEDDEPEPPAEPEDDEEPAPDPTSTDGDDDV